jgi:KipI family sensor histidine kinase inhibitor
MTGARITFLGDACLSVAFDEQIDPAINAQCLALSAMLERQQRTGIRDIVPGFHTVAVYFDPLAVDRNALVADVREAAAAAVAPMAQATAPIEIPVSYGHADGPDLPAVAAYARCSEAEVIRIHTECVYRVYMLGFLPGFAYLGSVDRRIAMARLETPRLKVPAGSVGIAGTQTAIYPRDTPGGWRIIGRTTVKTFDLSRPSPSLLSPGQRVRFKAA